MIKTWMRPCAAVAVLFGLAAGAGSAPAQIAAPAAPTTVKAGVDAWSRGEYKRAVEAWRPAAIAGDPDAQFNLGQAYKLGRGVPVDLALAEEWYRKAALQGHLQAEDAYGLTLFQNNKRAEAVQWLERSAGRGEARAQLVLGTMLFNGDIVTQDWVRAYALITRSSAQGLPQAAPTLAQMDQYIPSETRQRGIALAREYEAKAARPSYPAEVAGLGTGGPRNAELPPSVYAGNIETRPALKPAPIVNAKPKPVTKPPVAPAGPVVSRGWRLQVGAFKDQGNAQALWRTLSTRVSSLAGLRPEFVRSGQLTRLLIGTLASEAEAAQTCREIKTKQPGTPCVISAR